MGDNDINVNPDVRRMGLDPEKVKQFAKGWRQMEQDNAHDMKVIGEYAAGGTAIGAAAGALIPIPGVTALAGAGVGFLSGSAAGFVKVGYEKITKSGYYAGR